MSDTSPYPPPPPSPPLYRKELQEIYRGPFLHFVGETKNKPLYRGPFRFILVVSPKRTLFNHTRGLLHLIKEGFFISSHKRCFCHFTGTQEAYFISQKRRFSYHKIGLFSFLKKDSVISQKGTFSFHKTDLLRFRKEAKKVNGLDG